MTTEYEIDTPPNMELLGGETEQDEETEPEQEHEQEALDSVGQNEDENAEEEQAPPPKRDQAIPRARFDEVNAKLHAAREEAEQLRAALAERAERAEQAQDSVDVDDLEDQYYEAIMSGDKDEAKKIRSRINADLYARAEATSTAVVSRQLAEQAAESQFQSVVNQAVTVYPFLDSESKAANKAAIDDVLSWRGMYEAQGHSKAKALAMAVNKVGPYYHRPVPTTEEEPPVDTRKQKALRLAAETAALQPPRVDDGVGTRAIPVSKEILGNQDKWDRASESERMQFLQ
jgi:hypothetical protein